MARAKQSKRTKHLPYLKLKVVLVEKGIRQRELAELLGVTPSTLNQKINGALEFTFTEAETICDELKISMDLLRGQKVS